MIAISIDGLQTTTVFDLFDPNLWDYTYNVSSPTQAAWRWLGYSECEEQYRNILPTGYIQATCICSGEMPSSYQWYPRGKVCEATELQSKIVGLLPVRSGPYKKHTRLLETSRYL